MNKCIHWTPTDDNVLPQATLILKARSLKGCDVIFTMSVSFREQAVEAKFLECHWLHNREEGTEHCASFIEALFEHRIEEEGDLSAAIRPGYVDETAIADESASALNGEEHL